jgi:hypothetical protein
MLRPVLDVGYREKGHDLQRPWAVPDLFLRQTRRNRYVFPQRGPLYAESSPNGSPQVLKTSARP